MAAVEKDKKIFVQKCGHWHTVEKGDKHKTGPTPWSVRLLDSLTQMPTRPKASSREKIP